MVVNIFDNKIVTNFQLAKNTHGRSARSRGVINFSYLGPPAGTSLLALSLAACGGNDDSPYSQSDLDEIENQRLATQNSLNNLTQEYQDSLNNLTQEHQDSLNNLTREHQDSLNNLTRENDSLKVSYDTLQDNNDALEDRYQDLDDLYADLTAAKDTVLTVSRDNFIGSLSDDKIAGVFGSNATLSSADVIIDTNPGDNDVLSLRGSAFQTVLDTSLASVMVEQIDVVFDTLANATVNSSGITSASALNITNIRENSAASLSLTNLADGSVVNVSDFNSVSAVADENAAITVLAEKATGTVSTTVLGEGEAVINAPVALTITTSAERGNTTAQAEAATSFTAQSTSGSITLLSDANAYSRAISTFEGNITVNTPLADRVLATTTGEGSVSVVAEGDSGITVRGGSIAVLLESSDKNNKAVIKASGTSSATGTDDVLSIVSADNFTVKNQTVDRVETITISPTESIIATFEDGAASTYTGNPNVTLHGDHAVFHQAAITGSRMVITGMDLDTDLSKANELVELRVASIQNGGGESILFLNENAQLFLSADQTNGLEINADDDIANEYLSGTLNLRLGVDQSGRIVVDKSTTALDGFDRINITAQEDQDTPFQLVSSSQTKVTLSGTNNFTVGASTAEELDASGLSGDALGLSGVLTASQTANLLKIYGGSGNDALSSANTSASAVITGGPGNDSFTFSANYAGSADGGSGNDTLTISSAVDLSSATLANFEFIELNGNNTTLSAASLSGQTLNISSTGGAAVLSSDDIQSTTNLANLSFLDSNVSLTTNFETNKHTDLTNSSNIVVTGSRVNDIITGHAGNDNLTGGEGSDTIAGGAGEDTIILTETSSAADRVLINAVVGTSEDSGRKTVSGNGNDTGDDTVVGFAIGTDIVKIIASGVAGFVHSTDTAIGTAGGVDDGTAGSFGATVGLVELNQTTNSDWDDAGDIALTFSSATGTFNKANFEAALQYDLTLTNAGVTATTGDQDDTISGGTGNDTITAAAGADTISGGNGNDTITGGAGADTITGGAGADVFLIASDADHAIGETIAGGANADTIRFISTTASETLTLLSGVTDSDNAITVEISDAAGANSGTTALNLNADALVDTLAVTLIGNDGNNVLVGNVVGDTITGGAGADTITGGAGADTITGGAGADVFLITAAADHAAGETINAGANDDIIRFTSTTASETLTLLAGVTDSDNAITIEISDAAGANTGTTALNVNTDALGDTLVVTLIGNDGNNVLVGNATADTITGGAGADTITGGAGADVFIIAAAADHATGETITAGANADTIRFTSTTASETLTLLAGVTDSDNAITVEISDAAGANTGTTALNVNADALVDTLVVTLIGNDGNNVLVGNATADTITGGAGADTITGGAGADVFLIAAAADHAVGETIAGGANADTIRFTSTTASETLTLLSGVTDSDNAITVEISDAAGANSGTTALNVNADALVDTLAVTLIGNDGINVLVGNAIGDTITGGAGADTITGGAGADTITGGAGADVFLIAAAADHAAGETITAGANADTIRFTSTTASETLTLLAGVTDTDNAITVEISDAAGANTGTTALNVNADALVNTLAVTLIGNDGDNVLVGNATADTITGGAGADTITGGGGADTFVFNSTTGIDIIDDFSTAADVMNFARTTFALESADADLADANEQVTIAAAAGTDNNGNKNTANDLIVMTHTTGHTLASLVNDLDGATAAGDALIVYFDSGTSLTTLAYDNNLEDATAAVAVATFSGIAAANIAASIATADFVLI